jgi:Rrf2 family transcriptional regulator, iron-sulfur cluster assembly transcription factor
MQISRAGEYGVLGLLYLVREASDRTIMIESVSRDEAIPKSFLAKIFQDLVRAGILRSQRGAGGGFGLARPAEQISVLEIIEAIDGRIALQRCLGDEPNCERQEGCALCVLFEQAQDRLKEVFAQTSLADLARQQAGRNTHRLAPRRDRDGTTITPGTPSDAAPVSQSQPITFRQRQPRIQEIQP